jgi:hypothetical protein
MHALCKVIVINLSTFCYSEAAMNLGLLRIGATYRFGLLQRGLNADDMDTEVCCSIVIKHFTDSHAHVIA